MGHQEAIPKLTQGIHVGIQCRTVGCGGDEAGHTARTYDVIGAGNKNAGIESPVIDVIRRIIIRVAGRYRHREILGLHLRHLEPGGPDYQLQFDPGRQFGNMAVSILDKCAISVVKAQCIKTTGSWEKSTTTSRAASGPALNSLTLT